MAGVLGNKNACGCHATMIGNTNRLIHGMFSHEYLQKRAERNSFMKECHATISELEKFLKPRRNE